MLLNRLEEPPLIDSAKQRGLNPVFAGIHRWCGGEGQMG